MSNEEQTSKEEKSLKKNKPNCSLCEKSHSNIICFPECGHIFGQKCLEKHIKEKFAVNELYVPKCPECQKYLALENFEDLFGKELFKKNFAHCRKCDFMSYKKIFMELSQCSHKFCQNCFLEIKSGEDRKCFVKKCKEEINEDDIKIYKKNKRRCLLCSKKIPVEDLKILECCSAKYCVECLKKEIDRQLDYLKKFEEKKQKLHCLFCRKNLRSYILEDTMGEKGYKRYMRKYQKKEICEICFKFRALSSFDDLPCNHKICGKCLEGYIQSQLKNNVKIRKIECPAKGCSEKLTKTMVEKYIDNEEKPQGNDEEEKKETLQKSKLMEENKRQNSHEFDKLEGGDFEIINNSQQCYLCKLDKGPFVQYDCGHSICDMDFNRLLGSVDVDYEKFIICPKEDCAKKGVASLQSMTQLPLSDHYKQRFKEILENQGNQNNVIKKKMLNACQMCFQGFNPNDSIKMECSHSFCNNCIKQKIQERCLKTKEIEKILKCLENDCLEPMSLDNLKAVISDKLHSQLFKMQPEFPKLPLTNQSVSYKEKTPKAISNLSISYDPYKLKLDCGICLEKVKIDECLTLNCDHKFCLKCLLSEWTFKINNGQVDKTLLKCPTEGCKKEIDYHILKGNLDKITFEKYEKFLLSHTLLEASNKGTEKKEKTVICPNPKCGQTSYIWEEADTFKCPQCNQKYCAKEDCKGDWKLHQGKSCQQFKALKKNKSTAQEIMIADVKYIEKNYKKCPVCGIPIEKTKNCNYVRCESAKCQKKTLFCFLCGQFLNEKEIKFHYMNENPFLGCKNLNNQVPNEFSENNDRQTLKAMTCFNGKMVPQNQNKNFPKILFNCPKCNNKITESFSPIKNERAEILGSFFLCKSPKCNPTFFCGICNLNINSEENIEKHSKYEVNKAFQKRIG